MNALHHLAVIFIFSHPVSYAHFRVDVFRLGRIGFNLPPDVSHIDPENLIVAVCVGPPYIGQYG